MSFIFEVKLNLIIDVKEENDGVFLFCRKLYKSKYGWRLKGFREVV